MGYNKTTILSTRPVDPDWIALAAGRGIALEAISFIGIESILPDPRTGREWTNLYKQPAVVIFTSMNAVDSVGTNSIRSNPGQDKTDWRIFCIGQATRERVIYYFGEKTIAGIANSSRELAEAIVDFFNERRAALPKTVHPEQGLPGVVFFCGDRRRDELPDLLRNHSIEVVEHVVYRTIDTPHTLKRPYDGILFFSPSAVDSFFNSNTLPDTTFLFSIGTTTAAAIAKHCTNPVIISETPSRERLIQQALDFFTKP